MPEGAYETGVVVFEGYINPAIFTVRWLTRENLVSEKEAEAATVRFMDADLSRFDVADFRVEVRRDRVTVAAAKALDDYTPVREFVQGIFEVLPHTPVHKSSMSKAIHTPLPPGGWQSLEKQLVADAPWLTERRLQVLSLTGRRDDDRPGAVEVTVEPSQHVDGGAYIVATERADFPEVKPPHEERLGARPALEVLAERWDPWQQRSDEIIRAIIEAV